ncbi:MAG: pyrroline-5-carboxylate reductase [Flammeovirgaceae bacterium]
MKPQSVAIIGGGNLGISIAQGLVKSQYIEPSRIIVTRRNIDKLKPLKELGIQVTTDNIAAVSQADYVIVAVKPKQIRHILEEINTEINIRNNTLISVVTGVGIREIQSVIGNTVPVFRAMPNTAIAIRESMTCISSNNTTQEQQKWVVDIFNQLGKSVIIDESLMAAATVLGACGIAYSLRFIRAASQGGIEIGFSSEISQLIASQTVKGAAALLLENKSHPEQEIDKVTTPQGCTIAGLNEMEHQGFSSSLIKGVITSYKKIDKIAEDF